MWPARPIFAAAALLALLVGCKKQVADQDARRDAMFAEVTACPPPATCTAKMTAAAREVSVCAPTSDVKSYGPGDIVVLKELGVHDAVARVKAHHRNVYDIEFVDGTTLERSADLLVGRLCK
ncbi:MAG: hypothetical protein ABI551_00140 [Polyangiaceae bacterium]